MIKRVGDTIINPKHRASCHCGAVVLELDLPDTGGLSIHGVAIARYVAARAQ